MICLCLTCGRDFDNAQWDAAQHHLDFPAHLMKAHGPDVQILMERLLAGAGDDQWPDEIGELP